MPKKGYEDGRGVLEEDRVGSRGLADCNDKEGLGTDEGDGPASQRERHAEVQTGPGLPRAAKRLMSPEARRGTVAP